MDILSGLGHLAGASRFRRISERLYLDGDKIYQDAGIKFKASWFSVFYTIANSEHSITITEIADQIDFTHITVKNVLRELEKEGLVIVSPNPNDKRSKVVHLSVDGHAQLKRLSPLWQSFSLAIKSLFEYGHPDILNILDRIDLESTKRPINERVFSNDFDAVRIVDYQPSLKHHFYDLAAPWLLAVLKGNLEEEDKYTLNNPEEAYIKEGGFLFFAKHKSSVVGCVVLKRLDDDTFEFAKLFIDPEYRKLGIATKLIQRCITRCIENEAKELWLQTTVSMPEAHKLYYKLGFNDGEAPPQMDVLKRTEKIMFKPL